MVGVSTVQCHIPARSRGAACKLQCDGEERNGWSKREKEGQDVVEEDPIDRFLNEASRDTMNRITLPRFHC